MAAREIIRIDEEKCDGCGLCVPSCAEGAIAIIDGKAKLVSEVYCDGMGACLGHCPQDAITVEKLDAAAFDEAAVAEHLKKLGKPFVPVAEQHHPRKEATVTALPNQAPVNAIQLKPDPHGHAHAGGCPGSRMQAFDDKAPATEAITGVRPSTLRQWPVQLHLVSPMAPYFQQADLLLAADCVAFAVGDFHQDHLKGRGLAIACPKLDDGMEIYEQKLTALVDQARINTLTVMIMEVPCCGGLLAVAQRAVAKATRKVPIKAVVVSVRGDVLGEEWV